MTMDVTTVGCIGSVAYAVGMFTGAALEQYWLGPRRTKKKNRKH